MIVNLRCPDCGKFYKTRYWFNYHIRNNHPLSADKAVSTDKVASMEPKK